MLKKLFSIHYSDKLILEMTEASRTGALGNTVASFIAVSILYKHLPISVLIIWLLIQIITVILRIYMSKKLTFAINHKLNKKLFLNLYIFISAFSAFLFAALVWIGVFYNIPDMNITIIGILINKIKWKVLRS